MSLISDRLIFPALYLPLEELVDMHQQYARTTKVFLCNMFPKHATQISRSLAAFAINIRAVESVTLGYVLHHVYPHRPWSAIPDRTVRLIWLDQAIHTARLTKLDYPRLGITDEQLISLYDFLNSRHYGPQTSQAYLCGLHETDQYRDEITRVVGGNFITHYLISNSDVARQLIYGPQTFLPYYFTRRAWIRTEVEKRNLLGEVSC